MIKKAAFFSKGFTVIELVVTVTIFAFMTAFLVAKYGSFNENILITNAAYDVALIVRNAQSYGINVKSNSNGPANFSTQYSYAYGVHIAPASSGNATIPFFADADDSKSYDASVDTTISNYVLKNQTSIINIKGGTDPASTLTDLATLDITYKRPDPKALIQGTITGNPTPVLYNYAEFTLKAQNGATKRVVVWKTGQISVAN